MVLVVGRLLYLHKLTMMLSRLPQFLCTYKFALTSQFTVSYILPRRCQTCTSNDRTRRPKVKWIVQHKFCNQHRSTTGQSPGPSWPISNPRPLIAPLSRTLLHQPVTAPPLLDVDATCLYRKFSSLGFFSFTVSADKWTPS